jgi:hypothetical protein
MPTLNRFGRAFSLIDARKSEGRRFPRAPLAFLLVFGDPPGPYDTSRQAMPSGKVDMRQPALIFKGDDDGPTR